MIIGAMVLCVVTRTGPGEITKAFFKGFGEGFQSIYGIIICSGVFCSRFNYLRPVEGHDRFYEN